jgi:RNA polymerase sigma factor (sigma-70 family)
MSAHDSQPSLLPLFARLPRRDEAAINAILVHCEGRLKALTRRMVREGYHAFAFDTTHVYGEATFRFIKALRRLPLNTTEDFLRLAAKQIRWTLGDLVRRPKFVGVAVGEAIYNAVGNSTYDPVRLAMWRDFHEAVAALPDDDRRLFDLLYYQGLSLADAGELLGVPKATLRLWWIDARARLMVRFHNLPPV